MFSWIQRGYGLQYRQTPARDLSWALDFVRKQDDIRFEEAGPDGGLIWSDRNQLKLAKKTAANPREGSKIYLRKTVFQGLAEIDPPMRGQQTYAQELQYVHTSSPKTPEYWFDEKPK